MKSYIQILLISLLGFGCNGNKDFESRNESQLLEEIINGEEIHKAAEQDIQREEYYGFDTLLIGEYQSESGHNIRLEGSKSMDIYRINVKSKNGNANKFKITENWYVASHSFIAWDNENYIFIHYDCGTSCRGGLILSLNDNRGIIDYQGYIYGDSVRNIIVYPDSNDLQQMIIENFENQKSISSQINLCNKSAIPMEMIDSVYVVDKELVVKYLSTNCESIETAKIDIAEIEN